jgi:hypothetical protein
VVIIGTQDPTGGSIQKMDPLTGSAGNALIDVLVGRVIREPSLDPDGQVRTAENDCSHGYNARTDVKPGVASGFRYTCQAADYLAQPGLLDFFGRFFGGQRPDLALAMLRPPLALSRYLERVHRHFTDDKAAVLIR